jgi:hypothetical protein
MNPFESYATSSGLAQQRLTGVEPVIRRPNEQLSASDSSSLGSGSRVGRTKLISHQADHTPARIGHPQRNTAERIG